MMVDWTAPSTNLAPDRKWPRVVYFVRGSLRPDLKQPRSCGTKAADIAEKGRVSNSRLPSLYSPWQEGSPRWQKTSFFIKQCIRETARYLKCEPLQRYPREMKFFADKIYVCINFESANRKRKVSSYNSIFIYFKQLVDSDISDSCFFNTVFYKIKCISYNKYSMFWSLTPNNILQ